MVLVGLISMVFLEVMQALCVLSRRACAFIIRSMLADQPYSPVTRQHGESARRLDTTTFSTLSSRTSFMSLQSPSLLALASSKAFFSSSSSSMSSPSLVALRSFFPSNSFNWVNHVKYFVSLLLEPLEEWRSLNRTLRFTSNVVNSRLLIVHASNVIIERSHLFSALGGMVTQQFGNLGTVGRIFVDTKLEVLGECLVELLVCVLVLGQVVEHLETFLDQVLLDDAKDLVLLEGFTGDVERQIFGVDYTLDEGEPFWHDILAVVHDEYTTDVKFDVVELFLGSSLEPH